MKKAVFLLTGFFLFIFSFSQENSNKINGLVFEISDNESLVPLPGVNVFYINSNNETVTSNNGFFELEEVNFTDTLIFSFSCFESASECSTCQFLSSL